MLAAFAIAAGTALGVFSAEQGLARDWSDYGWAPRKLERGAPARLDLSDYGGWIVAHAAIKPAFEALVFRMRSSTHPAEFLEVRLGAPHEELPHVRVRPEHVAAAGGGWVRVAVPFALLDPQRAEFDKIIFRAAVSVSSDPVELDDVHLSPGAPAPPVVVAPPIVSVAVACKGPRQAISSLIYGTGFSARRDARSPWQWEMGATARRWGGNPTSRYNWVLGNAWNTADDWFFRNVDYTGVPGFSWRNFIDDNRRHGIATALTVPTIGWVAKDTASGAFPKAQFGAQEEMEGEFGNGRGRDGQPLRPAPPTQTSVAAPPDFVGRWARAIRQSGRNIAIYILDNEPALWSSTHRDVHPNPVTYDELLQRTIAYGEAVRAAADPQSAIAGPAAWGWPEMFYSAADAKAGLGARPDRRAHGDVPLLPWWLRKVREHERATRHRLIDLLDVHFYPQMKLGTGEDGPTDKESAAKRIRSVRGLWDPTYVDESWIKEPIRLIPRLRSWIEENAPGMGISIGEYNFGAEGHMSGGLAVAEALGRFGALGVASAFYWTYPPAGSPAFYAFRAFRNFDGHGGRFLDYSVPARANAELASAFASTDPASRHLVVVLLNHDPDRGALFSLDLQGCGPVRGARALSYAGGDGFAPIAMSSTRVTAPPYSMTVVDLAVGNH